MVMVLNGLSQTAFVTSAGVVALAEVGDKTQLLSLVLAARYHRPVPIVCGVLVATLLSHGAAGALGSLLAQWLDPFWLNWAVVASLVTMAVWILVPDKLESVQARAAHTGVHIFAATLLAFFVAEIGDKTQVVTIALAAQFRDFLAVVAGSTLGMMLANVPVIYLGQRFADRLPVRAVHALAALLFVVLGALALRQALRGGSLLN